MKSKQIRDTVFIAHRYIGLFVGILAAAIALTGSLLIIHGWTDALFAKKVLINIKPEGEPLTITAIALKARSLFPNLKLGILEIPNKLTEPITASWLATGDKWSWAEINPYTGELLSQPKADDAYTTFLWNVHINLLGGEKGVYVAGLVGLLATILCLTGIILWPGWRRLASGFKIKWNAKAKRLNFDLHKVVGIIAAVFLSMAMFTGFIWNYGTWTTPAIYAATFSPQPPKEGEIVSKVIPGKTPIQLTESLIQKASAALPKGKVTSIYFPTEPKGVFRVEKELPNQVWASAYIDRYSGEILKVDGLPTKKSMGDRLTDSFVPVHFGTFAGLPSRIFYVFVGFSPTILLITGLIMWRNRKQSKTPQKELKTPALSK